MKYIIFGKPWISGSEKSFVSKDKNGKHFSVLRKDIKPFGINEKGEISGKAIIFKEGINPFWVKNNYYFINPEAVWRVVEKENIGSNEAFALYELDQLAITYNYKNKPRKSATNKQRGIDTRQNRIIAYRAASALKIEEYRKANPNQDSTKAHKAESYIKILEWEKTKDKFRKYHDKIESEKSREMNNQTEENALVDIDEKLANKPTYKKMLNNLLGIGTRDNAVFTSSKTMNFDLNNILSTSDFNKIFSNRSFSVEIINSRSNHEIMDLEASNNIDEFIEIIEENGGSVGMTDRKLLEESFEENKEVIINKFKRQKNQWISKWKRYKNKYLDKQAQSNSWPLYVGTMFVKVKTFNATLYAPLILKKVMIDISMRNKIVLKSLDDSVEVNEKLLFLLQNAYKFNLPKVVGDDGFSFNEALAIYTESLKPILSDKNSDDFEFNMPYVHLTKKEVKNLDLQYAPGAILSILSPSGGKLRDKLIDLLRNGDPDDLLSIDMMQDVKNEVEEELEEGRAIYRITQTDLSQERAIIGSLKDSSIIWGPPGTGKSQTISNIIANLLHQGETAIITSEKKAALDVIQKRMGSLSKFMFFGLTDKNVDKKAFYKPFQDLAGTIRKYGYYYYNQEEDPSSLITKEEWDMYDQKKKLENTSIDEIVEGYEKAEELKDNIEIIESKIANLESEIDDIIWNQAKNYRLDGEVKWIRDFFRNNFAIYENLTTLNVDIDEVFRRSGLVMSGILKWKKWPTDAEIFKRFFIQANNNISFFKNIRNIDLIEISIQEMNSEIDEIKEEISEIENGYDLDKMLEIESNYIRKKSSFKNDERYLEKILGHKFAKTLRELDSQGYSVNSFLKNCESAWRIPYKFIDLYKDIISELFDVFVSTPQTLANIIDLDKRYDYAIFDEASQLHLEKAIPFISMANRSIIAGDHQQMKPTSYFEVRDKSTIEEEVEENSESLLDFAYKKGLQSREYMLTKNYRSKLAELMTFSSKEFYNGELDVVDNKECVGQKAIETYDVNGKWIGRANEEEADAALEKLLEEKDNYNKIILLTLNSTQKQFIESKIYNESQYSEIIDLLRDERVVLRNLENIQGDEADLVIVSIAYDRTAKLGSTYVAKPEGKNALNVAISRAIEKMIVFKSINSDEVSGGTKNDSMRVFREWLSFLELNSEDKKNYFIETNRKSEQFDSTFEEDVYDAIKDTIEVSIPGIYMTTQFKVGSYSVDLAISKTEGKKFVLGIEVDGYKYHSGFEKMTKDIERQRFIESKGYPIYRVTELNWKINNEKVMNDIKRMIERYAR